MGKRGRLWVGRRGWLRVGEKEGGLWVGKKGEGYGYEWGKQVGLYIGK